MVSAVHAQVLATLLPHVLRYNFETLSPRYALAARRLGLTTSTDDTVACEAIFQAAMKLASLTQAPETLTGYGIEPTQIPRLTEMALLSQATQRNGRDLGAENITKLHEAMF